MCEDHVKGSGDCRKSSESVGTSSERTCVWSREEECHVIVGSRVLFLERRQSHSQKYKQLKSFIYKHENLCTTGTGEKHNTFLAQKPTIFLSTFFLPLKQNQLSSSINCSTFHISKSWTCQGRPRVYFKYQAIVLREGIEFILLGIGFNLTRLTRFRDPSFGWLIQSLFTSAEWKASDSAAYIFLMCFVALFLVARYKFFNESFPSSLVRRIVLPGMTCKLHWIGIEIKATVLQQF